MYVCITGHCIGCRCRWASVWEGGGGWDGGGGGGGGGFGAGVGVASEFTIPYCEEAGIWRKDVLISVVVFLFGTWHTC